MTTKAKVNAANPFTSQKGRACLSVQISEEDGTTYNLVVFDSNLVSKGLNAGQVVTVKTGMDFRGQGTISLIW